MVCLLPVNVDPLREKLKKEESTSEDTMNRVQDAEELGRYFATRFQLDLEDKGLKFSSEPVENCLVWEIAIAELEPTLVALNVASLAAGAFVPGAGLASQFASGAVPFLVSPKVRVG